MHSSQSLPRGASGRSLGLTLALVSACAFGGSGTAAKPLIEAGLSPLHVVWLRVTGAALVLLPLAYRHRAAVLRRPGLLLGFGLLAVAGVQACYFAAISRIPVGVALLIEYLGPPLLLAYVRFVQRRPVGRGAAIGAGVAVTGLACVVEVWNGLSFDALGVLFALGAACCQVGYFVLADAGSRGERPVDPIAVSAYGLLIGALVLTVVTRPWQADWGILGGDVRMNGHELPALLPAAWMVLVATVLAYLTGVIAVRHLSPPVAGVVANLEAVVATVLAWVLLGEHLGAPQLAGGLLVLAGAFAAQTGKADGGKGAEPTGEAGAAGAAVVTGAADGPPAEAADEATAGPVPADLTAGPAGPAGPGHAIGHEQGRKAVTP
ncbi:membrane protein [Kitasatospora herbaricolor]|uniref:EamA family transporter n=1 Tax=Kitasatospora herbaricolor TaxID=68217 RepID=UPI00174A5006|nr:EamA family transporter [Kitasatospora herbaricolor]MDQ0308513.1 drug/metabolite transporter (DMT)-like permease [Kitasatospora herbaricolor]GGV13063.1 membrane protein [Kitasatospora herbaricolor]